MELNGVDPLTPAELRLVHTLDAVTALDQAYTHARHAIATSLERPVTDAVRDTSEQSLLLAATLMADARDALTAAAEETR